MLTLNCFDLGKSRGISLDAISQQSNFNANLNSSTTGGGGSASGSNNENEKLLKEIQEKIDFNRTRLQGNETNIKTLEKEINEGGVWAKVSGHKAALRKELEADKQFRQTLQKQQTQLEQTLKQTQQMMSKGNTDEAQKYAKEREEQRKDSLKLGSDRYLGGLKEANKGYKDADKFLERTETGLKIARNTAVVVGATVATGGVAAAGFAAASGAAAGTGIIATVGTTLAGYGTTGIVVGSTAIGTTVGTGIGALSNTAKASLDVAVYGKDAKEAFKEAGSQTLQDAKSSAIASAGTVAGLGMAGKVVGQATSLSAKALSGMVAGSTNSVVSTTINVTEARIKAEQEFTSLYSEQIKNMTPDQVSGLKEQFLSQRGLTTDQIIKNAAIDVTVGMVSGGQGGASGAVKEATKSTLKKVAMTGLKAGGSVAIGFTGAYAKGELTFEAVAQEISSAVVGDIVGEMASKQPGSTIPKKLVRKLASKGFPSLKKAQVYVERMERMNSLADECWDFHSTDKNKIATLNNIRKDVRKAATSGILEIDAAGMVEADGTPKRQLERTCAAIQRIAREEGYGIDGEPKYDPDTKKMKIELVPGGAKKMSPELYRYVLKTIEPDITPSDLFPGGGRQLEFDQGYIGDCYFMAGLYSLAKHPRGEQLLQKMITIRPDGTLKVVFPGFPNEPIKLTRANVRELPGVDGAIGVKILERAYAELRRRTDPSKGGMARKTALEGGFGHNALKALTGDERKWLDSSGNKDVLAGEKYYGIIDTFANSNPAIIGKAKRLLKQLSEQKDKFVVVANTPTIGFAPHKTNQKVTRYGKEFKEEIGFMDKKHRFFAGHGYSVIEVNDGNQTVTVVNPHNTKSLRYVLSYDDFLQYFCSFSGSKVNGINQNQKTEVNESKPPKPRLSLVDSDDVVLSRGKTPLFDDQIIDARRKAPETGDRLEADNGKRWPTKIEPENLPSEIQNDNSFVAGNRGDKKTVIFEDPNLEAGIGGDATNLSRSPSENIHRVRLREGAVKKINNPSSPEHTSSLRYLHEEIAHTHQKNFDLADPTKMSKDQFIAESIMNELVAKNTSNIKIGRENKGQDFRKLREAIDKGDYASAREFAEAWGKKHGADCGFDADFYYDFYGKWHDDANSSNGNGRTEVRRPSLATEEESSTAVLDRPKGKGGNGELEEGNGNGKSKTSRGNGEQDREVFQATVGSEEEAQAIKEFLAGTNKADGKDKTFRGNGKVRTEGAVKSGGRVSLLENGSIKVQAGKDGIYEPSQRPATDSKGNRLSLDSDRSKAARYDTGVEIEIETASGKKKLPVLVEPNVRQNGSELPHETVTNGKVQELLENSWKMLEDGLFVEKGNRGNRQESSGLEHLTEIHTEPITKIEHLIDSTTHGRPAVQRASQFPYILNKTQMAQLIREALQNPDKVVMSKLYGKGDVLNIFAKLNNNELAPGVTEVRITYSPENGLLTFSPSRGYIAATLAKKGPDGKPVMAEGGKKPQKVDETTDLLPENRENLMVVYIDDKGRVLNPENPSQGPTPLPELVNSN